MADMIMVEPIALSHAGAFPNYTVSRGANAANLIENDPREVFKDTGVLSNYEIDIDFGLNTSWDSIYLINVSASANSTWSVSGGAEFISTTYMPAQVLRMLSEDGLDTSGPARFYSPNVIIGRRIRITISTVELPAHSIGRLVVGRSFKPSFPREFGAGRPPIDTGVRTRLENGGLAAASGHLLSGFKWVFGDLNRADLKRLWGMFRRLRTTEPLILDEDPTENCAENVHYGTFIDLEMYDRQDTSKSRMAMSIEDWV